MSEAHKHPNIHLEHNDKRYEHSKKDDKSKSDSFGETRESSGSTKKPNTSDKMGPKEAGHLGGKREKKTS